jgi:hypothetical protein
MWSANPALIGKIDETSDILRNTTLPYQNLVTQCGEKGNSVGTGILDAYQAVEAALEYNK